MLCADGELGGQIYSAASDQKQASLVFNDAAVMVASHPVLSKRCKIIESQKRIVYRPTNSFYQAISAEAYTKHGYDASCIIYDELHTAPNRELWDVLTSSVGAREQPLVIAITTSGSDRNSICYELHQYAEKVRDGIVDDPTFLPVLFCLPDDADWSDEENWYAVNPALGDFRKLDEIREKFRYAKETPSYENTFRQLYLCQWTDSSERWIPDDKWMENKHEFTEADLLGRDCYVGVDLSSVRDLTAISLIFPMDDGTYKLLVYWFCPQRTAKERSKALSHKANYQKWAKTHENLFITDGNVIDYEFVLAKCVEIGQKFNVKGPAIDRLFQAAWFMQGLQKEGFEPVPWGQGYYSMSQPSKEFETLVFQNRLHHNGDEVLRWNVSNVVVSRDPAGNIKPDKAKSSEKIDGVVSSVMALGLANVESVESTPGVFFV